MRKLARRMIPAVAIGLVALAWESAGAEAVNPSDYEGKIRVACVGDSITFGAGIRNRGKNSYPAQLGRMLGDKWDVRNFGKSGATLLKKGDRPYWTQREYKAALKFEPHVVIIKLGTNDSKPNNWRHKGEYVGDYVALVKSFQDLADSMKHRGPKVWLCYPAPAYPGRWGITDRVMKRQVIPLIDEVSRRTGLPIIDLYAALSNKKGMFPDTVHPNAAGAKVMAETICGVLTGRKKSDKAARSAEGQEPSKVRPALTGVAEGQAPSKVRPALTGVAEGQAPSKVRPALTGVAEQARLTSVIGRDRFKRNGGRYRALGPSYTGRG